MKEDLKEGNPDQDTTITLTLDEGETFHDDEVFSLTAQKDCVIHVPLFSG